MVQTNSEPTATVLSYKQVSQLPSGSDDRPLGERLKSLREAAQMTQEDLAEASGVTRPQISLIESGKVEPRRTTREALAAALANKIVLGIHRAMDPFARPTVEAVAEALGVKIERLGYPDRLGAAPMIIRDAPVIPDSAPVGGYEVHDFTAGLIEVSLVAEVACGEPMDMSVEGESVLIPADQAPDPEKGEYLIRARGDSMVEYGIQDGDFVVVEARPGGVAATGELVIAWYDPADRATSGGITLKHWIRRGGRKILQGSTPEETFELKDGDQFELKGIVRRSIRIRHFPKISG